MYVRACGAGPYCIFVARSQAVAGDCRHVRGARYWHIVAAHFSPYRQQGRVEIHERQKTGPRQGGFGNTTAARVIYRIG